MKGRLVITLLALALMAVALTLTGKRDSTAPMRPPVPAAEYGALARAAAARARGVEVDGRGVVARVLPDDRSGSPHQRFLVRIEGGPTVLIAHNIEFAPRVDVREGDAIRFRGEYEWNDKGGVVHWTHRDPNGRHERGWIEHNGRVVD